jgi:tripartite-type tricarboxylate transporter receptor subunit TctC
MFNDVVKGRVWKFGDNISTDYIKPGFARGETLEEQGVLYACDPAGVCPGGERRRNMKSIWKGTKTWSLVWVIILICIGGLVPLAFGDYPTKPINVYVGQDPGAASGLTAQIFVNHVQKYLSKPQPFILNYKPGASGMIAVTQIINQPADGYNLVWLNPTQIINLARDPSHYSFTKDDLSYVGANGYSPYVIAINKQSPYKTMEEFIDYAKKHPEDLTFGSSGVAGQSHTAGEVFMMKTGIKLTHVPFSGGAPAVTALLGGHVSVYFGSLGTLGENIKPGQMLRVIAVMGNNRIPDLPDVPTCKEKGVDVGELGTFQGLAAKKGTPKSVLDVLTKAFQETANDPNAKMALVHAGFTPLSWGPEELESNINQQFEMARDIFKKLGLIKK